MFASLTLLLWPSIEVLYEQCAVPGIGAAVLTTVGAGALEATDKLGEPQQRRGEGLGRLTGGVRRCEGGRRNLFSCFADRVHDAVERFSGSVGWGHVSGSDRPHASWAIVAGSSSARVTTSNSALLRPLAVGTRTWASLT